MNNAGAGDRNDFLASSSQRASDTVDLNIQSVLSLTHVIAPHMVRRRRGRILIVSSIAGELSVAVLMYVCIICRTDVYGCMSSYMYK